MNLKGFLRKTPHFIAATVFALAAFPVSAKITFGDLNVSGDDGLLFSVNQSIPGSPRYKSLFQTSLGRQGPVGSPKLITCFPESVESLDGGNIIQFRNRYGTAWYNVKTSSLEWKDSFTSLYHLRVYDSYNLRNQIFF